MNRSPSRLRSRVSGSLSPATLARLDQFRPSQRDRWGGPLNGQAGRRAICQELAVALAFDHVIETGTYRGVSTGFFSSVFGVPVDTVEASPRFFEYSRRRLRPEHRVTVSLGDSRGFLRELSQRPGAPGETTFFYLDAHWHEDLPLRDE